MEEKGRWSRKVEEEVEGSYEGMVNEGKVKGCRLQKALYSTAGVAAQSRKWTE